MNSRSTRPPREPRPADHTYTGVFDSRTASRPASPTLFGLFFEDINRACDGGLNANLVNNYSFDAVYAQRRPWSPFVKLVTKTPSRRTPDRLRHWTITDGTLTSCDQDPIALDAHFARVLSGGHAVLENRGYLDVMPFRAGICYSLRLFARSAAPDVTLSATLVDSQGRLIAECDLGRPQPAWGRMTATLPCPDTSDGALRLVVSGRGQVDLDEIVLVPDDHWGAGDPRWSQGLLRRDIVEALRDLNPTFMRFPGGCIVEGAGDGNAYDWKRTVGPLEQRVGDYSMWSVLTPRGDYTQTYQIGFYEYFLLCEDLRMQPVPVVNAGMSCQMRSTEMVGMDTADMGRVVQDAIDLIDWATADPATNRWAALRAQLGHPEPFELHHLGIGNENYGPEYLTRFEHIKKAIDAHRPGLTLILSAGVQPDGAAFDLTWEHARRGAGDVVVDEHFYRKPAWFVDGATRYDDYPRTGPSVVVGEYAACAPLPPYVLPGRANSFTSALAEAAFLTGVERNADVISMTCYAPLLNVVGHSQWRHNLINIQPRHVEITPNYLVQQLFAKTVGTRIVDTGSDLPAGVLASCTATAAAQSVKLVNTGTAVITMDLALPAAPAGAAAAVSVLRAGGTGPRDRAGRSHDAAMLVDGHLRVRLEPRTLTVVVAPLTATPEQPPPS